MAEMSSLVVCVMSILMRFDSRALGSHRRAVLIASSIFISLADGSQAQAADLLKELQTKYVASVKEKEPRVYHFGSQGPGSVFSYHTSHTNRLVPVYVFGRKANLGSVTGENSRYRDPEKLKAVYGVLPENTVNPRAVYADQSDLYRVQKDAIDRGAKHIFIVWFDGLD